MSAQKIIAVVGATGAQGGGLVRAILDSPGGEFEARALTRNARSDKGSGAGGAGRRRGRRPTWTTRPAWTRLSRALTARIA